MISDGSLVLSAGNTGKMGRGAVVGSAYLRYHLAIWAIVWHEEAPFNGNRGYIVSSLKITI